MPLHQIQCTFPNRPEDTIEELRWTEREIQNRSNRELESRLGEEQRKSEVGKTREKNVSVPVGLLCKGTSINYYVPIILSQVKCCVP